MGLVRNGIEMVEKRNLIGDGKVLKCKCEEYGLYFSYCF